MEEDEDEEEEDEEESLSASSSARRARFSRGAGISEPDAMRCRRRDSLSCGRTSSSESACRARPEDERKRSIGSEENDELRNERGSFLSSVVPTRTVRGEDPRCLGLFAWTLSRTVEIDRESSRIV